MIAVVLQWLLATVVLVLINGVAQRLPWGVGSVQQLAQNAILQTITGSTTVIDVSETPIVTSEFDSRLASQVSTLTTAATFSWIVSKPISAYRPSRYLAREVFTQALVAIALVAIMTLTVDPFAALMVVGIAGTAGAVATYGQLTNWWGLTLRYAVGVSVTLAASWVIVAALITVIW
jgi:hypothetical protein